MSFKENLRLLRRACGFSQEDVANVLGVDRSAYSYYESGKTEPSITNLVKIARMYRVSTDTLVDNEGFAATLCVDNEQVPETNMPVVILRNLKQCSNDERTLIALFRTMENKELALETLEKICRESEANNE
ncbi:MAG: helix-turn-helix transcriptional regulator [Clostridia bacterium]|nr:helix-turn-helix transcriptional regulator [Clostridia bacterium]